MARKAHEFAGAHLVADLIQHPERPKQFHARGFKGRQTENIHQLVEPNDRINAFIRHGLIQEKYPNFFNIGFRVQAFVDISIASDINNGSMNEEIYRTKTIEDFIKGELFRIKNVILVYTVFGEIDLRCKIVGVDLRQIERTAMAIREIKGIRESRTSIIVDETIYADARDRWADLVRENADQIENALPAN